MVKEFVPVSIFNFCGSAILIDYISFNMAELILPLSGARSIKRMVNIWSNRTHILINYRWYELFISNAGKNFEKTLSNIDDLLYYPQFSAVNIIFPIWKMKVRRVFLFDVSKPKSWKCVGIWDFFVILNNWNSILFVYCWHTKCFHHCPLSRSHSWINNYRPKILTSRDMCFRIVLHSFTKLSQYIVRILMSLSSLKVHFKLVTQVFRDMRKYFERSFLH